MNTEKKEAHNELNLDTLRKPSLNEQILHVVCGSNGSLVKIITAYFPDDEKFDASGEKRKEQN